MANMSYCRFRNTLEALRDCYEYLYDMGLSPEEERARQQLIQLCHWIAKEADDSEEEE